ncbi:uncharacterized protein LOC105925578 [Fundulus heteroclitus]|uniref:uncharacterized protein LOC105925578 n=1 Tax=Fundulus heteroclitus TaxID=8078 RepID=UPI00165A3540|nr:uncharacterized protein LOC105925578 [Fundulus heteroclitus]
MVLGVCLRVSWFFLLICLGNCFPTDHGNTTSLSLGSLDIPDPELAASSAANESASDLEPSEEPSDSNSTNAKDVISPRASYAGPPLSSGEKSAGLSNLQPLGSTPGGFPQSSNPWFRPPLFDEAVYTGTGSHPYTYGPGPMGFPYYSYDGVHAEAPPYGYVTAGSPHYYSYATGASPPLSYVYGPYDRRMPIAPPYGMGRPPAYGYLPRQTSILDPELFLIGNIIMKVREMPLAKAWMTPEVPVSEKPPVYPISRLMQSNAGYHRTKDLLSNSQYSKEDLKPTPILETQQQVVPETGF